MCTLINQAAGGGLNGVPLEETHDIIEKATQDYHLWTRDRGNPKDIKGVQDLCNVDGTNDISKLTNTCQICGSPSHFADGCPVMGQDDNSGNQEDANYIGQNNQGAGFGYGSAANSWDNPNWNHPNLSYKPQNQAPLASLTNSSKAMHRTSREANIIIKPSRRRIILPTSRGLSTITSHKGSKIRIQGAMPTSRTSPSPRSLAARQAWRP
ncbi:unnamed protein product [Rhodiola kirilowii]